MKNRTRTYFLISLFFTIFPSNESYSKEGINILVFFFSSNAYSKNENNYLKTIRCNKESSFSKNWNKKSNNKVAKIIRMTLTVSIKNDSVKRQNEINPTTAKRLFFGKVISYGLPPAPGIGPCEVGVFSTYYFFGLKISGPKPLMIPLKKNKQVLIQQVVPCGTEYPPIAALEKEVKPESKEVKPQRKADF